MVTPNDMPARRPLTTQEIFRPKKTEEVRPEWAEDLRWKRDKLYAYIRPRSAEGPHHIEVFIELTFGGICFTSRQRLSDEEKEHIPYILDLLVDRIDRMMEEAGFHPYKIQSW